MAQRRYDGAMDMEIRPADLQRGPVKVASHWKIDQELREIFERIAFADPSVTGKFGNHDAVVVPFTTSGTANQEIAIAHQLNRVPVGFMNVVPLLVNYTTVSLTVTKAPDATNLYLKTPTTNVQTAIVIW